MKYFTKYLPVEGEVREGDKAFQLPTGKMQIVEKPLDAELARFANKIVGRKAVRLFLCSRDIQVGDKVFCLDVHENNPKHPPEQFIDPWRVRGEGDTCKACIKVIGEISPEATWVKEGDEFDEESVDRFWWIWDSLFGTKPMERSIKQPNGRPYARPAVRLRGECGYFH